MDTIEVDYEAKTVSIKMEAGKTLKKETLDKAFDDSRYSCTKLEDAEESKESEEG